MPITVSGQAQIFLYAVLGGILIALIYDGFRIKRKAVKTSNWVIYIEDFIYWVLVAAVMFMVIYYSNEGEIRGYIFIGTVLGVVLYMLLFSQMVIRSSLFIINLVKRVCSFVWRVVAYPFRIFFKALSIPCSFILKGLKQSLRRARRIAVNRRSKAAMGWRMFINKIKKF